MARKIVCRVCDSERFRKVVVTLPNGKNRLTDFDYCLRCATVFYRPGAREPLPAGNEAWKLSDDLSCRVPVDVLSAIAKSFPNPSVSDAKGQTVQYQHPNFGRLILTFRVVEQRGTKEAGLKWQLEEARRLTE